MRKATFIPCLIAVFVAGACGDKKPKSGDANAAEVTTTAAATSSEATPTGSVNTGPVSFDSAKSAYTEKRYGDAVRLFTAYTAEQPGNVWRSEEHTSELQSR